MQIKFWRREVGEGRGGMQDRRINIRATISSHEGMRGAVFCSPPSQGLNENQRSGSLNDLIHPLNFGVPAAAVGKGRAL